ncbi:MAG: M15 family metallopeptidase [Clostridium chrysemydis]|uniref:M15 family metallopeptidase n=1 Tax=Clostridium chrysemydis TaxID=2665504 RepID=UPI003F3ECB81
MKKVIILIILLCCGGYIFLGEMLHKESYKSPIIHKNIKDNELVLVNKENGVDKDYQDDKLVIPNIRFSNSSSNEEKHVSKRIAKSLEEMFNDAENEGIILLGNSGYRSYKSQVQTYNNRVQSEGKKMADAYVAKPGFSEHQTGLCIDITNEGKYFAKGTKEADWLNDNCYKYGFIIRYPEGKESVTGISYEPWHVRYVGKEAAKIIHNQNITLEEYLRDKA